jgi:hypothetical protein
VTRTKAVVLILGISVSVLALGLGCATSRPIHRPPTHAEIRAINEEARIRVDPLPVGGFVRRPVKIDHVVSADPEKIVAFSAGAPVAFWLGDVDRFRVRRRDRGAAIGATVGAGFGAVEGFFLVALLNSWGNPGTEDPPRDTSFPTAMAVGVAAIGAAACGAVGAVIGAIIGAPEDFPLVLGPPPPPPNDSPSEPPPPLPTPTPQDAAIVVAASAEVRSAPFKVAPVIATLPRGERLHVAPQPNAGWRVAFLRDGRVGYIQDAQVEVASP